MDHADHQILYIKEDSLRMGKHCERDIRGTLFKQARGGLTAVKEGGFSVAAGLYIGS